MRLRRLDLTRYGRFTDFSLDFGEAPLSGEPDFHLIYGLNEAGKSTSLAGFLDLLFGIEKKTRYDFLHPKAMQIGGVLEIDGASHELSRNQKAGSVPPFLLDKALSGLTRDAYRTMFSLDDDTLEQGGDAILASKGDLGELLFSASTGLSGFARNLERVNAQADEIYKKGGRKQQIAELKRQLDDAKNQRREIDTQAAAFASLADENRKAEQNYQKVDLARRALMREREKSSHLILAAPIARDHLRLHQALDPYRELKIPPSDWTDELRLLMQNESRLHNDQLRIAAELERVAQDLARTVPDAELLALSERIISLRDTQARYISAQKDLPKRRQELGSEEGKIAHIIASLGLPMDQLAQELILPDATLAILRRLIETWSGIRTAADQATRELDQAHERDEQAKTKLRQMREGEGDAPTLSDQDAQALQLALGRFEICAHRASLAQLERDLHLKSGELRASMALLKPFRGDEVALADLDLPELSEIATWQKRALELEKAISRHEERARDLRDQLARDGALIETIHRQSGEIDDQFARDLRQSRDKHWQAHLAALDAKTAGHFHALLQEDDALGAKRLMQANDLAQLRQLQREQDARAVSLKLEVEHEAKARQALEDVQQTSLARSPFDLSPDVEISVADYLARLETFVERRSDALEIASQKQRLQDEHFIAKSEAAKSEALLSRALKDAGFKLSSIDKDLLGEFAQAQLQTWRDSHASQKAASEQAQERAHDLKLRQSEFGKADAALQNWHADWQTALKSTWLDGAEIQVEAVRARLERLAGLPAALRERDEMQRRIRRMEEDQGEFADLLQALLGELGEENKPEAMLDQAAMLTQRLEAEKAKAIARKDKQDTEERLLGEQSDLSLDLAAHQDAGNRITGFFNVETLEEARLMLEAVAKRRELEKQYEDCGTRLIETMQAETLEGALSILNAADLDAERLRADELSSQIEDLDNQIQVLFAARQKASERLNAIGGDDAVALIEERRRTTLIEIEEGAIHYLRLKAGVMMAEKALHQYRDRHRSAMMQRASSAFQMITGNAYSGLTTLPDKDQEVLIGLRRDGGSKQADAMSKGTRFQLYLALRLAGYEEFATTRSPIPFIADDIMETFDEPRSEEVFRLFDAMAGFGQVIYLTHHRHLCDLAREVVPSVRIHELP